MASRTTKHVDVTLTYMDAIHIYVWIVKFDFKFTNANIE